MTLTLSYRFYCRVRQSTTLFRSMASVSQPGPEPEKGGIVEVDEVVRFIGDCFMKIGCERDPALEQAHLLATADYKGHYSHGLNRLDIYLKDIKKKLCDPNVKPRIVRQTSSTAYVNGMNTLGAVVGNFCMQLAIQKARDTGVGWVVANHSNHYGMASYYTLQAVNHGMVGLSFTNTSPLMCPTRAKQAALGTNPLSLAAPIGVGLGAEAFVLDMATTAVALGKIEMQIRKQQPVPLGWALDEEGNPTTDAKVAYDAHRMMPLGGLEETSGYKGYGLAMLVEVLCGIMGDASYGPFIREWTSDIEPANLGQCYVVVDPKCFGEGFRERMACLVEYVRNMTPADKDKPVLVPGDPEKANMINVDKQGGIIYLSQQLNASRKLAETLGIEPMKVKPLPGKPLEVKSHEEQSRKKRQEKQ